MQNAPHYTELPKIIRILQESTLHHRLRNGINLWPNYTGVNHNYLIANCLITSNKK